MSSEITERLFKSAELKQHCFLSGKDYPLTFETRILDANERFITLQNTIPFEHIAKVLECDSFFLQILKDRFSCETIETDGLNVIFPLLSGNKIEETREEERFGFSIQDNMSISLVNPIDKRTIIKKPILDMSSSGLSIRIKNQSLLFKPGRVFEDMTIYRDHEKVKKCRGKIVYTRLYTNIEGQQFCQVGFKISGAS